MIRALIPALLFAAPALAQSGAFQDTILLDAAVTQFTGKSTGEVGGARTAIDKRLKLAECALPQLDWRGSFHDAVVVRCMAPAWQIYVPVNVAPQQMAVAGVGAGTAPQKPVDVIKRGDPVTIEASAPGFAISRDGVAMGNAPAGGRLLVKVEERKPAIQAIAIDSGRVTLPGWGE